MAQKRFGEIPEWPNGTDCKSVAQASKVRILLSPRKGFGVFEIKFGYLDHKAPSGSSSIGRAPAFQAGGCGFETRLPLSEITVRVRSR